MPYRVPAERPSPKKVKQPLIRWNHWLRWLLYTFWWNEGPIMDHRSFWMYERQRELGLRTRKGLIRTRNGSLRMPSRKSS